MMRASILHYCALTFAIAAATTEAQASGLALNATGLSDGFTLTTAIGPYTPGSSGYNFVSVTTNAAGQMVGNYGGTAYVYNDIDGQTTASFLQANPITGGGSLALASYGGQLYGSDHSTGLFYKLNQNGTIASTMPIIGAISNYGLWANPVNGHLLASATTGLIDIDPSNNTFTTIFATSDLLDGVTVSPDGTHVYVADVTTQEVLGFKIVGGVNDYNSGALFSTVTTGYAGPDGMGVLGGTCAYAGDIVVNNNDGTVGLIDPSAPGQTVIASGGTRGDYAGLDTSNGTLFLSQNERIARIQAPAGCSIGTATTDFPTPEPTGLAVLASGLLTLVALRRRVRARV